MANTSYDLAIVGGCLGGSALAKAMAEHGARVLLLERERSFTIVCAAKASPRGVARMPSG